MSESVAGETQKSVTVLLSNVRRKTLGDPVVAPEVAQRDDAAVPQLLQDVSHGRSLIVPVFKRENPVVPEVEKRFGRDAPNVVQAVNSRRESRDGFPSEGRQVTVAFGDVRGVRNDEVELLIRLNGPEPFPGAEREVAGLKASGVFSGDGERFFTDVGVSSASVTAMQPLPVPNSNTVSALSAMVCSAASTSVSVSGRGIRTAGVTTKSRPQKACSPVR